jgi:hypothetical protein
MQLILWKAGPFCTAYHRRRSGRHGAGRAVAPEGGKGLPDIAWLQARSLARWEQGDGSCEDTATASKEQSSQHLIPEAHIQE